MSLKLDEVLNLFYYFFRGEDAFTSLESYEVHVAKFHDSGTMFWVGLKALPDHLEGVCVMASI